MAAKRKRSVGRTALPASSPRSPRASRGLQNVLLDTHTFLWFVSGSKRLSQAARAVIENPANTVYVSAASVWEIAIKRNIGKLPDTVQFVPSVSAYLKRRGFTELSMTVDHAEAAGELPAHHRDPFDRMLIAQARLEAMPFVSNEVLFDSYGVRRIW